MNKLALSTRVTLAVTGLLAISGFMTGLTLYEKMQHSLEDELAARLNVQIAKIEASLEFKEGFLGLDRNTPLGPDPWQIATGDGRVLWASKWTEPDATSLWKMKKVALGKGGQIVPGAVLDVGTEDGQSIYRLPAYPAQIELQIRTSTATKRMASELQHLAIALWSIGPLSLVIFSGLFSFYIRWQLRPFRGMAEQAAQIGPKNLTSRIAATGGSPECVQLCDSLNHMLERLAEGLEREQRFSAIAAHELRTPVAQLRTQIEVAMRRTRAPEEYQAALANCLLDVERLQALISGLLRLTREFNIGVHANQAVDLASVLRRAVGEAAAAQPPSPGGGAGLSIVIPDTAGARVVGAEEILAGAFRNVIENALRYAPGASPAITIQRTGGTVRVVISDCGPGIPEADRERIFQPLVRLDQARTVGVECGGFGLGLTSARMAVQACGGELTCMAQADGQPGARFLFVLKNI